MKNSRNYQIFLVSQNLKNNEVKFLRAELAATKAQEKMEFWQKKLERLQKITK